MEPLSPGARVERCNSPAETPNQDGTVGTVLEVVQADNGELAYFVRIAAGVPPSFWAASRTRLAPSA